MSIIKKTTVPRPYKVQYVFLHEVSSFKNIFDVYATIKLNSFKEFKDFYSSPGTIEFAERSGNKPAGIFYDTSLKLFFPGMDHESEARLFQLDHGKMIFRIYFDDNTIRFAGSIDYPMRVSTEISTLNDKTGILVTASHQCPQKSRFSEPIETILPPPDL